MAEPPCIRCKFFVPCLGSDDIGSCTDLSKHIFPRNGTPSFHLTEIRDASSMTCTNWTAKAASVSGMPVNGKTSKRMLSSPSGAIFVWANARLDYPRKLAEHLDRCDLEIVSAQSLDAKDFENREVSGIVLDHACQLTSRQFSHVLELHYRSRK